MLTTPGNASRILATLRELHAGRDLALLATAIMPDHVHLLFALGERLTLGQTMAKFKNLARDLGREPSRWLDDVFEHRLRPDELAEDYAFYIFMNPYRAGLIAINGVSPWWFCPDVTQFRFLSHLNADGTPPREWLDLAETTARRITTE